MVTVETPKMSESSDDRTKPFDFASCIIPSRRAEVRIAIESCYNAGVWNLQDQSQAVSTTKPLTFELVTFTMITFGHVNVKQSAEHSVFQFSMPLPLARKIAAS